MASFKSKETEAYPHSATNSGGLRTRLSAQVFRQLGFLGASILTPMPSLCLLYCGPCSHRVFSTLLPHHIPPSSCLTASVDRRMQTSQQQKEGEGSKVQGIQSLPGVGHCARGLGLLTRASFCL